MQTTQTTKAPLTFKTIAEAEEIFKGKLKTDPIWAARACEVIYQFQTASEKAVKETVENNKKGFNGRDAKFLSNLAVASQKYNRKLSPKQFACLFKSMPKYAGQLIKYLVSEGKVVIQK